MGAIKITPADKWFSKCIRVRAGWTCQRCGTNHAHNTRALDCSHFIGRGNWSVRFDPDNAIALCTACHFRLGGNPVEHKAFIRDLLGETRYDLLVERSEDRARGRDYRKTKGKGAISAHYKDQFEKLERFEIMDFIGFI